MSYTFSSPSLPPGFSIVGSKLLALANAPAFAGTITIAITDGFTTVNKVITIDRRPTTVSALVTQILDLVSITGPINSFVNFEIVVQTMLSVAGPFDSISPITTTLLLSVTGANDEFTLGASVLADNVTANGVAFNYRFLPAGTTTFDIASDIELKRVLNDTPQTTEAAIGCASGFAPSLLAAAKVKFNFADIVESSCYADYAFPGVSDVDTIIYIFRILRPSTGGS